MRPRNIIEKIWSNHLVYSEEGKPDLLYIDLHLVHEVTSPQAFEGLREKGRRVRRPDLTFATMDHNVPTKNRYQIDDEIAKLQMDTLQKNCEEFSVPLANLTSKEQGIVHVIGPELGLTLPGKTIVCGDSHTSTHGAFGALAFGIGTSEVEHVLATQSLWQFQPKTMKIDVQGKLTKGVTAKDVILSIIRKFGINVGVGYVVEFTGEVIRSLSMEERMTICNMSIEAGARAGLISPDETTLNYVKGKKYAPKFDEWEESCAEWRDLASDEGCTYDKELVLLSEEILPTVTWGTHPGMSITIEETIPFVSSYTREEDRESVKNALHYMGLKEGQKLQDVEVQHVFIGSCTNSRLSDLEKAASVIKGKKVHSNVKAIVVPGSQYVKMKAEEIGLNQVFLDAGFEWRESGCSMCLGMNPDRIPSGERCASTSNRNFEGRQGQGARTHLVSPEMAAAAAIYGHFVDIRSMIDDENESKQAVSNK